MDKELKPIPDTREISDQTPGQVMEAIKELPPERQQKVLEIRDQLVNGTYDVEDKIEGLGFRKV